MASCLGLLLWNTLTSGHPLRGGFPLAFLCLTLAVLAVLFLAALPRRPGEPAPPTHTRTFVWLPYPVVLTSLLPIVSELQPHPRLWPLLLLPLAGPALAVLAVRAHLRPAPPVPGRYPASASQNFCVAAQTATVLSMLLNYVLFRGHLSETLVGFTASLFFLVAVLVALTFQAAETALPPWFSSSSKPPMVNRVLVWLAWSMALFSAMPVTLIGPNDLPAPWPFALFPLGALTFALLCTHAHRQERARQREEEEAT